MMNNSAPTVKEIADTLSFAWPLRKRYNAVERSLIVLCSIEDCNFSYKIHGLELVAQGDSLDTLRQQIINLHTEHEGFFSE